MKFIRFVFINTKQCMYVIFVHVFYSSRIHFHPQMYVEGHVRGPVVAASVAAGATSIELNHWSL